LKSPHLSNPWPAAKAAPLPATAVVLLCIALGAQLAVPSSDRDLPGFVVPGSVGRLAAIALTPVSPSPDIMRAPIFSPDRRDAGAGLAAVDDFVLLGTVASPHGASAAIGTPDGQVATVGLGSLIGRWRLTAVARNRARFERDGEQRTLAVGAAHAATPATPAENNQ
jgi:hypothetical protein